MLIWYLSVLDMYVVGGCWHNKPRSKTNSRPISDVKTHSRHSRHTQGTFNYTKKWFIRPITTYTHYKLKKLFINNNSALVMLPVLVGHHSLTPSSRRRMAQCHLRWRFLSCGARGHTWSIGSIGRFTRWGTVGALVSWRGWWCRSDHRAYLHG